MSRDYGQSVSEWIAQETAVNGRRPTVEDVERCRQHLAGEWGEDDAAKWATDALEAIEREATGREAMDNG